MYVCLRSQPLPLQLVAFAALATDLFQPTKLNGND
jgi:hypothetical protein